MKTMTCKQLGGACDIEFKANTFEEIVELSKSHGMEMFQAQDIVHTEAMIKIQKMMQNPQEIQEWFQSKQTEFNSLSED